MISRPNKRILILCEGETEYFYAKALQAELPRHLRRTITIEIDYNSRHDPINLVKEARRRKSKARKEKNPYDSIWLFFDNDNYPNLNLAFDIIHSESFSIAFSSICIEHWFILHFQDCGRAFTDCRKAFSYLKRIWPEYHKTKLKHYMVLRETLNIAIDRAKILKRNSDPDIPVFQRNPYFTIDKLIDFFDNIDNNNTRR